MTERLAHPGAPPATCSDGSAVAGEQLAGTASQAVRWLVLEWRGAWGRDAIADSELPADVLAALDGFDGKALLVRRPDRRTDAVVFQAVTTEEGGTLTCVAATDSVTAAELARMPGVGESITGPLLLVCTHGRRDPCCARRGLPMYDALLPHVAPELLWQSSHQGGHRFAANVLALPAGIQLGRVNPADAARVYALLRDGRIPLEHYRGRTLYEPVAQAAEVAVRRAHDLEHVADVRLIETADERVRFAVPWGEVTARVTSTPGPPVPASCGDEPASTVRFVVEL